MPRGVHPTQVRDQRKTLPNGIPRAVRIGASRDGCRFSLCVLPGQEIEYPMTLVILTALAGVSVN